MTNAVESRLPPPRRPQRAQVRRLLSWSGAALLGAGFAMLLLSEGPFSRIEDNSEPDWSAITSSAKDADGAPIVTLADGRVMRLREQDGVPWRDRYWILSTLHLGTMLESGPVCGERTDVNVWLAPRTCGTGTRTWIPFYTDEKRWMRVERLRAEIVVARAVEGDR